MLRNATKLGFVVFLTAAYLKNCFFSVLFISLSYIWDIVSVELAVAPTIALTGSLPSCSTACQSPGGQAAAERGWWADQGGVRLLEPQEENLQRWLPHPQRQAGEEGWLKHQRPLCGLPPTDREDADQEGRNRRPMEEVVLLYLLHANCGSLVV